jgi:Excalibur calcium-binding domain
VSEIHLRRADLHQARRTLSTGKLLTGIAIIGLGTYLLWAPEPLALLGPARTNVQQLKFAPSAFSVDRNCDYFRTQAEAQAFFEQAGPNDPHRLDDDGDGIACEFDLLSLFGR